MAIKDFWTLPLLRVENGPLLTPVSETKLVPIPTDVWFTSFPNVREHMVIKD